MRIALLGPPGAGKGTQAQLLGAKLHIPVISTGDMLRTAMQLNTALGRTVKEFVESGKLVPDSVMIQLVEERLQAQDCKAGFVLDGYPRTTIQAEALRHSPHNVQHIIEIQVPEEDIVSRMAGRLVHPNSGRIYHITIKPPKTPGRDDITGEPLLQRTDDSEAVVRERLAIYNKLTQPVIEYYFRWAKNDSSAPIFHRVSGTGDVQAIHKKLLQLLISPSP